MPVHIDELTTEVVAEPESLEPSRSDPMTEWQELDRARQLMARHQRDRMRVAAEGFDD